MENKFDIIECNKLKEIYSRIYNDEELQERYREVEKYEEKMVDGHTTILNM